MIDEAVVTRFMALFAGLERAHGTYKVGKGKDGEKLKGSAFTVHSPVTVELWAKHLNGVQGIGIVPIRDDGLVLWSAIDIDEYLGFDVFALEEKVHAAGLPLVVCRSKSGGAHLFLFLKEPLPCKFVRLLMNQWAMQLGHTGVEVFPKQDSIDRHGDVGNWINMPYFDAENTTRYAVETKEKLTPEQFLHRAEHWKAHADKAHLEVFAQQSGDNYYADGPPCLQYLVKNGFPRGSRNKALFQLGVLTRLKSGDDWQVKLEEINRTTMQPPLATMEVGSVLKSLSKKSYFYQCNQDPIASVCQKELCRTRAYGIGNSDDSSPPVLIDAITKVLSDPPIYIVSIEGKDIEVEAAELLNQSSFRKKVFEKVDRIIPPLSGKTWDAMINDKMSTMEIREAPEDSGPEGQFRQHLETFCIGRSSANALDEILLGKPFNNPTDGRSYFRSGDLIKYLDMQHFRDYSERRVWASVARMGGQHHRLSMKGKPFVAWSIPSFKKQTEEHAVPHIDGDDI